jgi:hypothetical protein
LRLIIKVKQTPNRKKQGLRGAQERQAVTGRLSFGAKESIF